MNCSPYLDVLLWTNARRKQTPFSRFFLHQRLQKNSLIISINQFGLLFFCVQFVNWLQPSRWLVIERNLIIWTTSPRATPKLIGCERWLNSSQQQRQQQQQYGRTVTSFILSGSSLAVSLCFNHLSSADCGDEADSAEPLFHCPLLYLAFKQLFYCEFHVAFEAECNLPHQMERFLNPFDFSDLSIW